MDINKKMRNGIFTMNEMNEIRHGNAYKTVLHKLSESEYMKSVE